MHKGDKKISIPPLTMGTVALGISYGVFEDQKRPDTKASLRMLEEAYKQGVTCFDTAREYGDAEAIIGEFAERSSVKPLIVSKFKLSNEALKNKEVALREATISLRKSLKALKLETLPVLLFHNTSDLDQEQMIRLVPEILERFKKQGLIRHGGLSIDHPSELKNVVDIGAFEVFQVPLNVFDQRLIQDEAWDQLCKANKTVIARSVFLKGLLLRQPNTLTGNLKEASIALSELQSLADKAEMSVAQFCFSYIRDLPGVSSIVFGAEQPIQIVENIGMMHGPAISTGLRKEAEQKFRSISETILTPRLWQII